MIKLPPNLKDRVNPTRWGKEFDPTDKDNLEELAVNGHIMFFMLYYKSKGYDDICLWEYFQEDFKSWILDIWNLGSKAIIREFQDFLRENSVYVLKDKALIAMNIQAVLNEEEQHK
jgi:hypothetical protein